MGTASTVNVVLSGNASALIHEMRKANNAVNEVFEGLNEKLGKRSVLGEIGEISKGTGSIKGLSELGGIIGEVAHKAVELKDALNEGKISAGEMVEELIKGVPVVGKFWEAGRNIREFFTGEQAAIRAINEDVKVANEMYEARRKILMEIRDIQEKGAARDKELRRERELIGVGEPVRGAIGLRQKGEREREGINKDADTKLRAIEDDEHTKELRKALGENERKLAASKAALAEADERHKGDDFYAKARYKSGERSGLLTEVGDAQRARDASAQGLADIDRKRGAIEIDRKEGLRLSSGNSTRGMLDYIRENVTQLFSGLADDVDKSMDKGLSRTKEKIELREKAEKEEHEANSTYLKQHLQEIKESRDLATRIRSESDPLFALNNKIKQIYAEHFKNPDVLDDAAVQKAIKKAQDDFSSEGGGGPARLTSPTERRFSLYMPNRNLGTSDPLTQTAKEMVKNQVDANKTLDQINTNLKNMAIADDIT